MQQAGREVHPDDLPPALHWESGIWWLYLRVQTQWRSAGMGGRIGLDYGPVISLVRSLKWNLALVLELLQSVEMVALNPKDVGDD